MATVLRRPVLASILMIASMKDTLWQGTGLVEASGALCPFDRMVGLKDQARQYLGRLAAEVLPGAEVSGYNPEVFERSAVTVGFALTVPAGEADALEHPRHEGRHLVRLEGFHPGAFRFPLGLEKEAGADHRRHHPNDYRHL